MEAFWARVDATGICWEWTGALTPKGYARSNFGGKHWLIHRLVWTLLVGDIPEGMTLDHLCRNRRCCNPDHLEPVPHKVNALRGYAPNAINARKTHCKRGHPLDESSIDSDGHRRCRRCHVYTGTERKRRIREGW
jgi:hypothetical protein